MASMEGVSVDKLGFLLTQLPIMDSEFGSSEESRLPMSRAAPDA